MKARACDPVGSAPGCAFSAASAAAPRAPSAPLRPTRQRHQPSQAGHRLNSPTVPRAGLKRLWQWRQRSVMSPRRSHARPASRASSLCLRLSSSAFTSSSVNDIAAFPGCERIMPQSAEPRGLGADVPIIAALATAIASLAAPLRPIGLPQLGPRLGVTFTYEDRTHVLPST